MGKPITGKEITCQTCGKIFYIPKNRFGTAKFCSYKCMGAASKREFRGVCEICGNEFTYVACREGKAKYCSRKCYYKAQHLKGTVTIKCKECGKDFQTSPSCHRVFCSRACLWINKKKTINGSRSTMRRAMLRRELIEKCLDCGYDAHKEILGIHHIDGNEDNNSIENIAVLCPNCHSVRHSKHIVHGAKELF